MEVATMLDEVDRRIAETKKDMYEFKRDVIGALRMHASIGIYLNAQQKQDFWIKCAVQWVLRMLGLARLWLRRW